LSSTQLNAAVTGVDGTFVYTPAEGTILSPGNNQTLSVAFKPTDSINYTGATKSVTINVIEAVPVITWANPAPITYGAALGATQLNATASVAGAFTYDPPAGTVLNAGSQTLTVTFNPTDAPNSSGQTASVTLIVNKATPVITWANPAPITYGTALGATQLDASSGAVAGSFTYNPAAGAILNAGNGQVLSAAFTPTDPNYSSTSATAAINVNKAAPVITWANPAPITYGTALSSSQLNASSGSAAGSFTYNPAAGAILNAGNGQVLSAAFTSTDPNYSSASATAAINVNKATPVISWANPAPITYGTALSGSQLNATASVAGTFTYAPVSGTVLNVGSQTLSVTFNPTDTVNYVPRTVTVSLVVQEDYLADALRAVRISIGLELDDLSLDVAPLENCSTSDGVTRCTSHPDGHTDLGDVIVLMRRAQGLVIW
jgi:hypothetical protein